MNPLTLARRAALLAALLPMLAAAAPAGLFTIVDGAAPTLLRGTQRLGAAEGVRVQADDIVRTGADTRLARLELADGSTLDLGPATELLLRPEALPGRRGALGYLLRGWLKVGGEPAGVLATPHGDVNRLAGQGVLRVTREALLVFAESGRIEIGRDGLADGDAYVRRDGTGRVLARPPAELLDGLPRGFVDTLPRRAAKFEPRRVEPAPVDEATYADASAWLNAEPALRAAFVPRFAPRAADAAFRSALVQELRAHPEWDRTLFPEKYRPRPVAVVVARRTEPAVGALPPIDLHGLMAWPVAAPATPTASDEDPR